MMKKSFISYIVFNILLAFGLQLKASEGERKELEKKERQEVIKVFEVNEKLHNSFYDYQAKKVVRNAEKLAQAMEGISNPEVKNLLKYSQKKLKEISASKDKKANSQIYHMVSMALIHVLNQYDLGDTYNAYSCPMVKKKWVQNSKKKNKVHNPYASNMPHCGSKDTAY